MKKQLISGWLFRWLKENWVEGLNLSTKLTKWKKDLPNHPEYHDATSGCAYGQADGRDDFIKDCDCPEGWFE